VWRVRNNNTLKEGCNVSPDFGLVVPNLLFLVSMTLFDEWDGDSWFYRIFLEEIGGGDFIFGASGFLIFFVENCECLASEARCERKPYLYFMFKEGIELSRIPLRALPTVIRLQGPK